MLVRSRMTRDVVTASPDTLLAQALELTRTHRIRHLPVVESGRLVGIVSDRDLRFAHPPVWVEDADAMRRALHEHTISEIMTSPVVTIAPDVPVEEAARVLQSHPFGCLPVVDDGALVGIITESDILRALAELMGPGGITSRMEVLMPNRPGELARVIRVIGIEMRINIAGIFAPVVEEHCHAVMHLQTASAAPVVEALRKMGYVCGSPAIELDGAQLPPPRRQRPAFQL